MKTKSILVIGLVLALWLAAVPLAGAQETLGDAATNLKGETTAFGQLALALFGLIGFVLAGLGIVKLINARKNNEPIGSSVGMIIGGAVLTVLVTFIGLTTQSTVGEDPSSISEFGE